MRFQSSGNNNQQSASGAQRLDEGVTRLLDEAFPLTVAQPTTEALLAPPRPTQAFTGSGIVPMNNIDPSLLSNQATEPMPTWLGNMPTANMVPAAPTRGFTSIGPQANHFLARAEPPAGDLMANSQGVVTNGGLGMAQGSGVGQQHHHNHHHPSPQQPVSVFASGSGSGPGSGSLLPPPSLPISSFPPPRRGHQHCGHHVRQCPRGITVPHHHHCPRHPPRRLVSPQQHQNRPLLPRQSGVQNRLALPGQQGSQSPFSPLLPLSALRPGSRRRRQARRLSPRQQLQQLQQQQQQQQPPPPQQQQQQQQQDEEQKSQLTSDEQRMGQLLLENMQQDQ